MIQIDIITNIAPHYRSLLWRTILFSREFNFHFLFGSEPDSNIRQIDFDQPEWHDVRGQLHKVKNRYVTKVLVWQQGVIWHVLNTNAKAVIMLDMMYTVTTWLSILIARLRGIRVVLWGHGFYGNERGLKRRLRLFFLRRADSVLVYGSRAKVLLVQNGFKPDRVHVVYNSLDYDYQKSLRDVVVVRDFYRHARFFEEPDQPTMIFVGRLTAQKELDLAIDAVAVLQPRANLVFVGDGPERSKLEEKARPLIGRVHFFGPCYDELMLGKLIANADICLSPGEVGLTAIHSLAFGTPVCTHNDFSQQMPEVDALQSDVTGVFFDYKEKNIAQVVGDWLMNRPDRETTRKKCFETIDSKYNPYSQLKIIESALNQVGVS